MTDVCDKLVRYLVSCARAVQADAGEIMAAGPEGAHPASYTHENFRHGAHVFLALYLAAQAKNPWRGKREALDEYVRECETWVAEWERSTERGEEAEFAEWPPYIVCRGLDLVGGELDAERRRRWQRFVAWFVDKDIPKPFFFTAPNHEAWRLALTALAGRVLRRPDWVELAAFQTRQMLTYQTAEGFWEEGRHHGPSMKYNSLMLAGLALIAEETGDEAIRAAAERLADFMVRWSFPDGVTVGAFDGRQSTSPGYFGCVVPGLELAAGGVEHMRRIMDFWERAGWLDEPRAVGPSNWYAYFGMPFAAESLLYFSRRAARAREEAALPLDAPDASLENHSTEFDGVLRRQGPWCVALSGQLSDVPKDALFIYRLERQSRVEIWHERGSVVVGGGHSLLNAEHPLYDVWVDSGYEEEPTGYSGEGKGDVGSPAMARRRSKYYARAARTWVDGASSGLELVFAHATVRLETEPAAGEMRIRYSYRAMGAKELRVALPVVLWRGSRGFADGSVLESSGRPTKAEVRERVIVEGGPFGSRTTLVVPKAGHTTVLFPLWPVRTYGRLFEREKFESFFAIARVETALTEPGRSGSGEWRLRVE